MTVAATVDGWGMGRPDGMAHLVQRLGFGLT
jgi:hypothetical protein